MLWEEQLFSSWTNWYKVVKLIDRRKVQMEETTELHQIVAKTRKESQKNRENQPKGKRDHREKESFD